MAFLWLGLCTKLPIFDGPGCSFHQKKENSSKNKDFPLPVVVRV
jgi:hypothetical protein